MNPYLAFAVAAAVTYLLRVSMTIAGGRIAGSARSRTAIVLVTPAVLAAMVVSALVVRNGHAAAPPLREVVAVGVAFAVVRRTRNFGLALAVGLPVYWLGGLPGLG